ncbi:MAG: glycerol-3-phosphate 1-O-acyltransferase PlsY [Caldicoprobacterales bacterium]|jgi:glycerol-3-phosphate acyltransferase PlsY|nr:glycerol-3-phosphate 1-O-acyltransferase PlsY [Clostridiales bacterium]
MSDFVKYLLVILISYLIGNFAPSYFMGKIVKNIDIREHGSGNAGATNAFRVLGALAGGIVFIFDVLKGVLAVHLGLWLTGSSLGGMVAGGMAVIGHDWPVMLRFKGGKGIASSLGLVLVLFPKVGLILLGFGLAVIFITRYVSLGSICAVVLCPILLVVFGEPVELCLIAVILAAIAVLRHRENILRMLKGTENRISFSKKRGR